MAESPLQLRVKDAMKEAMRAKEKERLAVIRMIQAEFKRVIVDERIDLDDARVLVILDKMQKQRRDSEKQYRDAGREDLASTEALEIGVIQEFLPTALSSEELQAIVAKAVTDSGAAGMQEMGKVMGLVKPQVQGRADMGEVSKLVKAALA